MGDRDRAQVMPRQDSTADQLCSVTEALDADHPDAALKLRMARAGEMTDDEYRAACRAAVRLHCYDAHDHLRRITGRY